MYCTPLDLPRLVQCLTLIVVVGGLLKAGAVVGIIAIAWMLWARR
jgi:hypothetical protein